MSSNTDRPNDQKAESGSRTASIGGDVSDSTLVIGDNNTIWVAPPDARTQRTPSQAAAPVPDFEGRVEELGLLEKALANVRAVLLTGAPGIGKSATAAELVARIKDKFEGGNVSVRMSSAGGVRTAFDAARHVMASVLVNPADFRDDELLLAEYRTTLRHRPILVVLEDVDSFQTIEPLIPAGASALIATSRSTFVGPGLEFVRLSELDLPSAVKFLLRVEPRIGESAEVLARLCGRLPLALRLASGFLRAHDDYPVAAYLADLQKVQARADLVKEVVEISFNRLTEEQKATWLHLAAFAQSFAVSDVRDAFGGSIERCHKVLTELRAAGMLEWSASERRYRFHDLLRDYAEVRTPEQMRRHAVRRHRIVCLDEIVKAYRLWGHGPVASVEALRVFDRVWPEAEVALDRAAQEGWDDEVNAGLFSEAVRVLSDLLPLRVKPEARMRLYDLAAAAAARTGNKSAEAAHRSKIGWAHFERGEIGRAEEVLELGLSIARQADATFEYASCLLFLGNVRRNLGNVVGAAAAYEEILSIAPSIRATVLEIGALSGLGTIHHESFNPQDAIPFFRRAVDTARSVGNMSAEASAVGNLGLALGRVGDLDGARAAYERQIEILEELRDERSLAVALMNQASLWMRSGDREKAVTCGRRALTFLDAWQHPHRLPFRVVLETWSGSS